MNVDYQFGRFCFRPLEGIVTDGSVTIQLTPVESRLLSVLCEHAGQLVNALELFMLSWREGATSGWRARLDTNLTGLRKKLQPHLPELIQNHRGRGYRLSIAATCSEPVPAATVQAAAQQRLSRHQLMARLLPDEAGGGLGPDSDLVIQSGCPLELLPEYADRVVDNILRANIRYTVFLSVRDIDVIAAFAVMVLESLRRRVSATQEATPITAHALFSVLAGNLRMVLTPHPCVDSIYIVNAGSEHRAEAYYYLSDKQSAIHIKEGDAAKRHAGELLRIVPQGQNAIIQFAVSMTEQAAVQKQLRKELLRRVGCAEEVRDLMPDEKQHLNVVPMISG